MQVQIHKLDEISPKWAEIIEQVKNGQNFRHLEAQKGLDLSDHRLCVVGEAHKWDGDYTDPRSGKFCEKCTRFSADLIDLGDTKAQKDFAEHFMSEHK
jgi:hypothetical protein